MQIFNEITDTITGISFSEDNSLIAISSWDGCVYFYHASNHSFIEKQNLGSPVLCICFCSGIFFAGCAGNAEGNIYRVLPGQSPSLFAVHKSSVTGIESTYIGLVTCSLDCTAIIWVMDSGKPLITWDLPEKAFSMSVQDETIAIACASRYIVVIEASDSKVEKYESSLRHQTSKLIVTSNKKIVVGSVEGRISVQEKDKAPMLFKAHLHNGFDKSIAHCIHAMDSDGDRLYTGGSDGVVNIFDLSKPCIINSISGSNSISYLKLNGNNLYVSTGYNWENGPKDVQKPVSYLVRLKANK